MRIWARQFEEHCLFIQIGCLPVRNDSGQTIRALGQFIFRRANQLRQLWKRESHMPNSLEHYAKLLDDTNAFTEKLFSLIMEKGFSLGTLWAAQLEHMTEEGHTIFRLLPDGPGMNLATELHMWLREAATKTIFPAHTIDPTGDNPNKVAAKASCWACSSIK